MNIKLDIEIEGVECEAWIIDYQPMQPSTKHWPADPAECSEIEIYAKEEGTCNIGRLHDFFVNQWLSDETLEWLLEKADEEYWKQRQVEEYEYLQMRRI